MNKSLSGKDLIDKLGSNIPILRYSELANYDSIEQLMGKHPAVFILYETTKNRGHWVVLVNTVECGTGYDVIEHFDSYGYFPDDELKFVSKNFRRKNNMIPHLSWLLAKYMNDGGTVSFNQHRFQRAGPNVATCGRWALLRIIMRDMCLKDFKKTFDGMSLREKDKIAVLLTELI